MDSSGIRGQDLALLPGLVLDLGSIRLGIVRTEVQYYLPGLNVNLIDAFVPHENFNV